MKETKANAQVQVTVFEWCKDCRIFIVITTYDRILFFEYFVLGLQSLKDVVTL